MNNSGKIFNKIDDIIVTCESDTRKIEKKLKLVGKSINYDEIPDNIRLYIDEVLKESNLIKELKIIKNDKNKGFLDNKSIDELRNIGAKANEVSKKFQLAYFKDSKFLEYLKENNIDKHSKFEEIYIITFDYFQKIGELLTFTENLY